ncbi:MAG: Crp/Fnr family transcriptional regulator [Peptococcaceae bacterium]
MDHNFKLLKKISLFSELDESLLKAVAGVVEEKRFKKNEVIFLEGDPGAALFFIKSGKVKISKISEGGREVIVHIMGAGDIFAEVTLFQKEAVYPATAEVIDPGEIGMIKNAKLEKLILENSQMALELIRALTTKLLTIQDRIKHLGTNDAVERTVQVLLALAEGHGRKVEQGVELCLNITRHDLAAFVGTTRETISRILSKLNQGKIIDISGKSIIITDLEALKDWVN